MKDTKIFQILRTFSPAEMKEFGYFVHSPFYNRVKNVSQLFDVIRKFHPSFDSRFLKKESVFKRVTGNKQYNDAVMRNLSSDLYNLAKQYVSVKAFQQKNVYQSGWLIVEMKKRQLENIYTPELEKMERLIEDFPYMDEQFHFDKLLYWNLRNNNFDHKNIEIFQKNFENEVYHLVHFFVIHLFDRYFQVNKFKTSYNTKEKHTFLKEISDVLKNNGYMDSPVVQLYYSMFMISVTMEEAHYLQLKQLLNGNFNRLSKETKFMAYHCLAVFFSNNERKGIRNFRRDRFELYRNYISSGDLIRDNLLSPTSYQNAVEAAILAGEYDWAEKFVSDYKKFLHHNLRQDAYYIGQAKVLHARGKNEEALGSLAKVISTNLTLKAVVRVLELRILFELELYDQIFHKLDSFRHFVSKNEEMSQNLREALDNFFRIFTMLVEMKTGNSRYTPGGIRKELLKRSYSFSMEWLEDKIESLVKHPTP
jgi:hypothetical protein